MLFFYKERRALSAGVVSEFSRTNTNSVRSHMHGHGPGKGILCPETLLELAFCSHAQKSLGKTCLFEPSRVNPQGAVFSKFSSTGPGFMWFLEGLTRRRVFVFQLPVRQKCATMAA